MRHPAPPQAKNAGSLAMRPALYVFALVVAACAVPAIGGFLTSGAISKSLVSMPDKPAAAKTADEGSLRDGELTSFLMFECASPDGECGHKVARDYCGKTGATLVRWLASPAASANADSFGFRVMEIVCQHLAH